MPRIVFNSGVIKLDTNNEYDLESAIFLAFNPANADHSKYDALEKSLPQVEGLKRRSHRAKFAFNIMQQLKSYGFEIIKEETKVEFKEVNAE